MHQKKIFAIAFAVLLLVPITAMAAPQVKIGIIAEKEVVVTENGQTVTKRVPATEAAPGETVIYTLTVANSGDEAATNVVVNDPIPEGTSYLPGSASNTELVTFSIDSGENFKKPSLLSYEITNPDGTREQRVASPEQYTHIRWQIPEIAAGASQELSFQVKVK
jgi:uncharacterized repeat protein (TIGR01451 family)